MMRHWMNSAGFGLAALLLTGLVTTTAMGQDYSKNSKAKKWGLTGEEKALFSGKVVDVLCELSGNCATNCGDGARHMGIVRSADNRLVLVTKNRQPAFNGATEDLLPYCGKTVDVDGVMVGEDPKIAKVFLVQLIRISGTKEWNKANLWTKRWAQKNPGSGGKGPWFKRDPRVKKQIKAEGYLGLGHAADEKWRKEQ